MNNQTRIDNFIFHYNELWVTFDNLFDDVFYHCNNKSLHKLYSDIFDCLSEHKDTLYIDIEKFNKIEDLEY